MNPAGSDAATGAFDELAASYDLTFTETHLGRYYRDRVQAVCARYWPGAKRLLELNAGTGADAVYLASLGNSVLATDASRPMLETIRRRIAGRNCYGDINTSRVDLADLGALQAERFDGVLSNFGGLNCIADLDQFAQQLSARLKPGGEAVLCIMGPWVPWEWLWFGLRADVTSATRRLSRKSRWRNMDIHYPSAADTNRAMQAAGFKRIHREGLGFVMPPSYASDFVNSWPRVFAGLGRVESTLARLPCVVNLSDHHLSVYRKQ